MNKMYRENRKSLNFIVGCSFDCVYCKPSFQKQLKRQRENCLRCYEYIPHVHSKRLLKAPPKTVGNEFIFFPSSGDPFWATPDQLGKAKDYTEKFLDRTFWIQSKSPDCFKGIKFSSNVILATTMETNLRLFHTPSKYRFYQQISKAPIPHYRFPMIKNLRHPRKALTIEPILQFKMDIFSRQIVAVEPEIVYIGYDNHNCKLPEPRLSETKKLIHELEQFTEVRIKSLRKAWYE